jgi:hypothetical protein
MTIEVFKRDDGAFGFLRDGQVECTGVPQRRLREQLGESFGVGGLECDWVLVDLEKFGRAVLLF